MPTSHHGRGSRERRHKDAHVIEKPPRAFAGTALRIANASVWYNCDCSSPQRLPLSHMMFSTRGPWTVIVRFSRSSLSSILEVHTSLFEVVVVNDLLCFCLPCPISCDRETKVCRESDVDVLKCCVFRKKLDGTTLDNHKCKNGPFATCTRRFLGFQTSICFHGIANRKGREPKPRRNSRCSLLLPCGKLWPLVRKPFENPVLHMFHHIIPPPPTCCNVQTPLFVCSNFPLVLLTCSSEKFRFTKELCAIEK